MINIRKYDPFEKLNRDIDRMFDRSARFPRFFEEEADMYASYPRADINEQQDKIIVSMDLPGMDEKDITIHLENNVLSITGERRFVQDEHKDNYQRVERAYGKFSRSFTLPYTVNHNSIEAHYKNGVLEISMPKTEESKPRQISIKVG